MHDNADDAWVDGKTLSEVLASTAAAHPERDALVFPQLFQRLKYAEFLVEVRRLAGALVAIGVGPGDHVGIWSTNWPQWVLTQFATAEIGAVLVNVNPAYRTQELGYILRQADLHTLILTDKFRDSNYEETLAALVPSVETTPFSEAIQSEAFPRLRRVISIKEYPSKQGIWPWQTLLEQSALVTEGELKRLRTALRPDLPVNIQYTSGTTGSPKGAVLSHRNLLLNAYYVGQCMHITEQDRVCVPVPLYHCFGCVLGTLLCAVHGAAMVIPAENFDADATLEAIARERCTALYGVPTMFNAELNSPHFDEQGLATLRTGIMSGSPCPIELMRQVTSRMHLAEMTIAYGQTEASPVITQTDIAEPLEIRVTTVGKALPGVEVRIVDPATLQDVPEGEQGELWSRGHLVMLGYYNKPEETGKAITADGWLRTGDLATRTSTGHYRITGRSKDVIIRGGENIYPREVEEFLLGHPKIMDVQVVGLPNAHYGEQVSAWIVRNDPTLTEEEVREWCKGQVAHFKIPHYIVFVENFPLTVTGKIQKFRLREMGIEQFHLQQEQVETA